MAGLGKYKKGVAFTLKSGNNPPFKKMGSKTPAYLNNFGIGPGSSPYTEHEDHDEKNKEKKEKEETTKNTTNTQGGDAAKTDKGWVKALKIGTTLLSGGIQGVYGGEREYPRINYGKKAEVQDDLKDITKIDTTSEYIMKDGVKVANPNYVTPST